MSTPYTPSPTYHTQIDVTVDGDLANAGEFNTPYQQCADNAAYCKSVLQPLVDGGTISPTAKLFLAQSFEISGGNSLTVTGGIECFGFFECLSGSGSHFVGDMTCDAAVNCASFSSVGDATVGGELRVTGAVEISGNCQVDGNGTTVGNQVVVGNTTLVGPAVLSDTSVGTVLSKLATALTYGPIGTDRGRCPRRPLIGTDTGTVGSHQNVQPAVYDWVIWPAGTLTAERHWNISDTGFPTVHGDSIEFTNLGTGGHDVTIYHLNGIAILGTVLDQQTGRAVKVGTDWIWAGAGPAL